MFKSSNIGWAIMVTALCMPVYLISPPDWHTNALMQMGHDGKLSPETVLPLFGSLTVFGVIFITTLVTLYIIDKYEAKKEANLKKS